MVVIANAYNANTFTQTESLPLKKIRGQISRVPATRASTQLKTVICTDNYITPAWQNQHCLGATFNINDNETTIRQDDHLKNINNLKDRLTNVAEDLNLEENTENYQQGRVGFRCTSPDYLPIVGLVPNIENFKEQFAGLRKDATCLFNTTGDYFPGLYVNLAHGSRGITTTPLCGDLLAAQICGEPLPLERPLVNALNPARFTIRELIRNQDKQQ